MAEGPSHRVRWPTLPTLASSLEEEDLTRTRTILEEKMVVVCAWGKSVMG